MKSACVNPTNPCDLARRFVCFSDGELRMAVVKLLEVADTDRDRQVENTKWREIALSRHLLDGLPSTAFRKSRYVT